MPCFGLGFNFIFIALVLAACWAVSSFAPEGLDGTFGLKRSALNALESSIQELAYMPAAKTHLECARAGSLPKQYPPKGAQASMSPQSESAIEKGEASGVQKRKRVTPFIAKTVGARYGWRCATCGKTLGPDFQTDHIIPLHQGGRHEIENMQPLHPRCHALKNSREQSGARTIS